MSHNIFENFIFNKQNCYNYFNKQNCSLINSRTKISFTNKYPLHTAIDRQNHKNTFRYINQTKLTCRFAAAVGAFSQDTCTRSSWKSQIISPQRLPKYNNNLKSNLSHPKK